MQLLGFMYGWLTFYHQGYEVAKEFRPYMTDLQVRLQKVSSFIFINHIFITLEINRIKPFSINPRSVFIEIEFDCFQLH